MPTLATTQPAALPADWRDILALTKPRVMSLVVFSGLCGMLAAPVLPPFALGFTAILCIALGAGACGALNQWYEADIDAKMRRTAGRPDGPAVGSPFRRRAGGLLGAADGAREQLASGAAARGIDPVLRARLYR